MEMHPRNPLSSDELEKQIDEILRFLNAVHPSLASDQSYKPSVELRPIQRGTQDYMLSHSLNLWDLTDQSVNRLRKFLSRHNGQQTCLYYSVFTYDNQVKTTRADGKLAAPGKITKAASLFAEEIALDFDHVDFDGYTKLVDLLESMNIYAMWVFTGHGYQAHILLDKPMRDKMLLQKAVYLFRAKGLACDPSCVDPSRVMRLPATYNCKCFADDQYASERQAPPYCKVVQYSNERYPIEYIFAQLGTLKTVSCADAETYASLVTPEKFRHAQVKAALQTSENSESTITLNRIEYPYLAGVVLPEPYQKMLAHTPAGYRNKVLGVLIKYFKTVCRIGAAKTEEILRIWSVKACDPPYEPTEFHRDFKRLFYQYNGLCYDSSVVEKFGFVNQVEVIRLSKQDIFLPTRFFEAFPELEGQCIRLFLAIKMLEHLEELPTQDKLSDLLSISVRSLRPSFQVLLKKDLIFSVPGRRRLGIPNSYRTSLFATDTGGFMRISYNDIKTYVTELFENGSRANNELKLYLYMRWRFWAGSSFMSQENLGQEIGVKHNTVCDLVSRLQERDFIKITKHPISPVMVTCEYTLLR